MPADAQTTQTGTLRVVLQILLVSLLLMMPAILLGHIIGHSSVLNVNWAGGFARQLAQGEIYPRWLPEMNGGAGSPVFYFYGPLPFFITAPFIALTGSDMLGVVLGATTMLAASGFAAYLLCRLYSSRNIALLAATLYVMMPYHFAVDIWYRSAFGEQASFVFMPLAAFFAIKLAQDWRYAIGLSLSFAAQLLSHLPTALLFAPMLALLCIWVSWRTGSFKVLMTAATAGALAICVASVYILPAATLQSMIQPDYWRVIVASDHLLLTQKMQEDFSFFIFPQGLVVAFALFLCVVAFIHRKAVGAAVIWAVIGVLAIFFCSILSQPLWNYAGPFSIVQLPWRLFCVLDLATVVLFAVLAQAGLVKTKLATSILAVAILAGFIVAGGAQYLYYQMDNSPTLMTMQNDRERVALRADASEYLPACLDQSKDEYQAMTYRRIAANKLIPPETGTLPYYYYPFLEARSGNTVIPLACDPKTGFVRFDAAAAGQGPIVIQAKAMPVERTAWLISLVSLTVLAGALLWGLRRNPR